MVSSLRYTVFKNFGKIDYLHYFRRMIKDFQKRNPYLLPDNWKIGGKNSEFAIEFKNKTGRELDEDIIKDEIVSELTFNMFRDIKSILYKTI